MLLYLFGFLSFVVPVVLAAPPPIFVDGLSDSLTPRDGTTPTYNITITTYGRRFGDSESCVRNSVSCGFVSSGFTTAISEALFGASSSKTPMCGTCWYICIGAQLDGNPISNPGHCILAIANDLCPAQGNPICSNKDLTTPNSYGAVANFDLCDDSGATNALFSSNIHAYRGWATKAVDCNAYNANPTWQN